MVLTYDVIFASSGSNNGIIKTSQEAVLLKQQGVHITILAVANAVNPYELSVIASNPTDEYVHWSTSYNEIMRLVEKGHKTTCNGRW